MPPSRAPEPQTAPAVLMIRPRHFDSNPETLESNRFQTSSAHSASIAAAAAREFDELAVRLAAHGVRVHAFAGRTDETLPDEIFPNNWASFHADGTAVLYPMLAPNRRAERRHELLDALRAQGFRLERVVDLTPLEQRGLFLEGTGSLVLDRVNRVAYACRSPRTSAEALAAFGEAQSYEIEAFEAVDRAGVPVYHTNVMMSVGSSFALLCGAAITDSGRRLAIERRLASTGHEVIDLRFEQLRAFAGNVLELATAAGPVIALSTTALRALDAAQRARLGEHGRLVTANIGTVERYGGGGVRCMLAEVFLPFAAANPPPRVQPSG